MYCLLNILHDMKYQLNQANLVVILMSEIEI